jgi:hypothetical protein
MKFCDLISKKVETICKHAAALSADLAMNGLMERARLRQGHDDFVV